MLHPYMFQMSPNYQTMRRDSASWVTRKVKRLVAIHAPVAPKHWNNPVPSLARLLELILQLQSTKVRKKTAEKHGSQQDHGWDGVSDNIEEQECVLRSALPLTMHSRFLSQFQALSLCCFQVLLVATNFTLPSSQQQ